jgi:hypothetical protein
MLNLAVSGLDSKGATMNTIMNLLVLWKSEELLYKLSNHQRLKEYSLQLITELI